MRLLVMRLSFIILWYNETYALSKGIYSGWSLTKHISI